MGKSTVTPHNKTEKINPEEILRVANRIESSFDKMESIKGEYDENNKKPSLVKKGGVISQPEMAGVEEEDNEVEEQIKLKYLRERYPEESFNIACDLYDNIQDILFGTNCLEYQFDSSDTDITGLSFSFRSLSASEENDLKYKCRINSWDVEPTPQSMDLFYFEQVVVSMTQYCGKNLNKKTLEEKRKLLSTIPFTIMKVVYRKYNSFLMALELLGEGNGVLDIVKKYLAPRH